MPSYTSRLEASLKVEVVQLAPNCYAAKADNLKMMTARYVLERAIDSGELVRGGEVIEVSSGTFALALMKWCRKLGIRLTLVLDIRVSPSLIAQLEANGVRTVIVSKPKPVGGFQAARLERAQEMVAENPQLYWTHQYDNPRIQEGYGLAAEQIVDAIGSVDCLVGAVGSGGSLSGTGRFLQSAFPSLKIVAVDTFQSVLFGQTDGSRPINGMGNSIMPPNLVHSRVDEVHWVSAATAYRATQQLLELHGFSQGPTSGAAYLVGNWHALQAPNPKVVVLMMDSAARYPHIFSQDWLQTNGVWLECLPENPWRVFHPREAYGHWAYMRWNRQAVGNMKRPLPCFDVPD